MPRSRIARHSARVAIHDCCRYDSGMKRIVSLFWEAFFTGATSAAFILLTTAGLVGAILAASFSTVAIGFCVVMGLLGVSIVYRQMCVSLNAAVEQEEIYKSAKPDFDALPSDEKQILKRLVIRKVLPYGSGSGKLEATGFVWRDGTLGSVFLVPAYSRAIPRLVKEWEKSV